MKGDFEAATALRVESAGAPLRGILRLPGDKSLSHRALILSSLASGESHITGLPTGEDVASTRRVLEQLGVSMEEAGPGALRVQGVGVGGLRPPGKDQPLDCGNSGTTVRLLAGAVAQGEGEFLFVGDGSLSRRPMERIAVPLRAMGANVTTPASSGGEGGLPLLVRGPVREALDHRCEVASAQVKSSLLLAGLSVDGTTRFRAPAASRDHTERMLRAMGCPVEEADEGRSVSLTGPAEALAPLDLMIPGDPSSAAFLVVAAILVPGSEVVLPGVLGNPGRLAYQSCLQAMGARLALEAGPNAAGEPVVLIRAQGGKSLRAVEVPAKQLPSLIDEVPILAVAAARARGTTCFRGAGELRHKESDRLQGVVDLLTAAGVEARVEGDDLLIEGNPGLRERDEPELQRVYQGQGDHRLAMAGVVLALTTGGGRVEGCEPIAISYPGFASDLRALGARITP